MKYMIHTYPKRLWYVNYYLVPSMINQGIKYKDIMIVNDKKGLGNLKAFIKSLSFIKEDTWHLQDDVLIASDFKKKTEVLGRLGMIVSGFCHYEYNEGAVLCTGFTIPKFMFMTFPCIFIPKFYSDNFIKWINLPEVKECYKKEIESGKNDDLLFYNFININYKDHEIYNCSESLVEHVDYLLGGSSINPRTYKVKADNFKDKNLVKELERRLKDENKSKLFE